MLPLQDPLALTALDLHQVVLARTQVCVCLLVSQQHHPVRSLAAVDAKKLAVEQCWHVAVELATDADWQQGRAKQRLYQQHLMLARMWRLVPLHVVPTLEAIQVQLALLLRAPADVGSGQAVAVLCVWEAKMARTQERTWIAEQWGHMGLFVSHIPSDTQDTSCCRKA